MTTLQIQKILPLIQKEAWVCYRKMKQPTSYTIEDLIQEGTVICLQKYNDYDSNRNNKFVPYILMCMRSHFAAIVQKSYRTINKINSDISSISIATKNSFDDAIEAIENVQKLTHIERKYLLFMFSPPTMIQNKIKKNSRKKRIYIRELLNLSNEKERKIRMNIFTLFRNTK